MARRSALLCAALLIAGCGGVDSGDAGAPVTDPPGPGPGPSTARASAAAAASDLPRPPLVAPRRAFPGTLELLTETPPSLADSTLLLPTDLNFSHLGLLVFDAGAIRIRLLSWSPALRILSYGRAGRGPGEFSLALRFAGTYDRPMAYDRETRRYSRLEHLADSIGSSPAPNRPIKSSCVVGDGRSFGTVSASDMEFFRKRRAIGDPVDQVDLLESRGADVLDSFALPLPELRRIAPLGRQATTQQLDDSTCILIAPYQSRFAVTDASGEWRTGAFVEVMPIVDPQLVMMDEGRSARIRMPRGARIGAIDARGWRDLIVVLFEGESRHARRLLDLYDRTDLTYRGSLVLPDKASRIAIRGDTLAVIAEREDTPVVQLFRLARRGEARVR